MNAEEGRGGDRQLNSVQTWNSVREEKFFPLHAGGNLQRRCDGSTRVSTASFPSCARARATICVPPMRLVTIKLLLIIIEFI
jgi:hypothetical protein